MDKLLLDDAVSAYWVGFIAADGSFVKNRLKLCLGKLDEDQVNKFQEFMGYGNVHTTKTYASWAAMNTTLVPQIMSRYDFKPRKTYNPPERLPYADKSLLASFLIGFVDGDGCIKLQTGRKTSLVSIKCHASWGPFLQSAFEQCGFSPRMTFAGDGKYCVIGLYRHAEVVALKKIAQMHKLPILARKWDKIDQSLTIIDNRDKDVCLRGHTLIAPNLVKGSNRACLSCARARTYIRNQKSRKGLTLTEEEMAKVFETKYEMIMKNE